MILNWDPPCGARDPTPQPDRLTAMCRSMQEVSTVNLKHCLYLTATIAVTSAAGGSVAVGSNRRTTGSLDDGQGGTPHAVRWPGHQRRGLSVGRRADASGATVRVGHAWIRQHAPWRSSSRLREHIVHPVLDRRRETLSSAL